MLNFGRRLESAAFLMKENMNFSDNKARIMKVIASQFN